MRTTWLKNGRSSTTARRGTRRFISPASASASAALVALSRSQRELRVTVHDAPLESRPLAGPPHRRPVHHAITQRPAVGSVAALDGPRNAHELALDGVGRQLHGGVAVTCHVEERQV